MDAEIAVTWAATLAATVPASKPDHRGTSPAVAYAYITEEIHRQKLHIRIGMWANGAKKSSSDGREDINTRREEKRQCTER